MRADPIESSPALVTRLTRRHLIVGWTGLLVFLSVGIALEAIRGLKSGFYLGTENTTRRLIWTLAHTHGNPQARRMDGVLWKPSRVRARNSRRVREGRSPWRSPTRVGFQLKHGSFHHQFRFGRFPSKKKTGSG